MLSLGFGSVATEGVLKDEVHTNKRSGIERSPKRSGRCRYLDRTRYFLPDDPSQILPTIEARVLHTSTTILVLFVDREPTCKGFAECACHRYA